MFINNKKGFTLLEVLVAVAIIGIIGAIAIPTFNDYRKTASLTAVNATAGNIAKAYNLCVATRENCTDLSDIKISCDICGNVKDGADGFCTDMTQKVGGAQEFKACVNIKDDKVTKTYGGDFKVCYVTSQKGEDNIASNTDDSDDYVPNTIKPCDKQADCNTLAGKGPTGNTWVVDSCKASSTGGVCNSTGGCDK